MYCLEEDITTPGQREDLDNPVVLIYRLGVLGVVDGADTDSHLDWRLGVYGQTNCRLDTTPLTTQLALKPDTQHC